MLPKVGCCLQTRCETVRNGRLPRPLHNGRTTSETKCKSRLFPIHWDFTQTPNDLAQFLKGYKSNSLKRILSIRDLQLQGSITWKQLDVSRRYWSRSRNFNANTRCKLKLQIGIPLREPCNHKVCNRYSWTRSSDQTRFKAIAIFMDLWIDDYPIQRTGSIVSW